MMVADTHCRCLENMPPHFLPLIYYIMIPKMFKKWMRFDCRMLMLAKVSFDIFGIQIMVRVVASKLLFLWQKLGNYAGVTKSYLLFFREYHRRDYPPSSFKRNAMTGLNTTESDPDVECLRHLLIMISVKLVTNISSTTVIWHTFHYRDLT